MGAYDGVGLDGLVLTGPRLTLRPWAVSDGPDVMAALADGSIHRFIPLPEPYDQAAFDDFVAGHAQQGRAEGAALGCAVVRTDDGGFVGSALLRLPVGKVKYGEIGYWVAPEARGSGYAAEAVRTLAEWGFDHGVQRIEILCDVMNLGSAATALKAGFVFEGYRRGAYDLHGDLRDDAVFSRLAADDGAPVAWSFPHLREPLTDGVISLRAFTRDDIDAYAETANDATTVAVGFTGEPEPLAEIAEKRGRAQLDWMVGGSAQFVIVDVETERVAGDIQLRKSGPPGTAGIGYAIHPEFRARAYTSRALRLLSAWAFENGYARLELGAKWHNVASQKAAAAAGFTHEGTLAGRLKEPDGSYADELYYGLVNPSVRRSADPSA